jgi:hypothetical protein
MNKAAVDRLAAWRPLGLLTDLVHTIADIATGVDENRTTLQRLEMKMADNSALLNQVADGLTNLGPAISALVAENASLRGEDTAESAAASRVKEGFDHVAGLFTTAPEVPDVQPLPPVDEAPAPADGGDTPTPADGSGDVVNPTPGSEDPAQA